MASVKLEHELDFTLRCMTVDHELSKPLCMLYDPTTQRLLNLTFTTLSPLLSAAIIIVPPLVDACATIVQASNNVRQKSHRLIYQDN